MKFQRNCLLSENQCFQHLLLGFLFLFNLFKEVLGRKVQWSLMFVCLLFLFLKSVFVFRLLFSLFELMFHWLIVIGLYFVLFRLFLFVFLFDYFQCLCLFDCFFLKSIFRRFLCFCLDHYFYLNYLIFIHFVLIINSHCLFHSLYFLFYHLYFVDSFQFPLYLLIPQNLSNHIQIAFSLLLVYYHFFLFLHLFLFDTRHWKLNNPSHVHQWCQFFHSPSLKKTFQIDHLLQLIPLLYCAAS